MAEENARAINPILRPPHIWIGDPAVLLEIIAEGQNEQIKQRVNSLYLEAVAEALQAHLKFVQGLRSVLDSSARG